ncbi:MAG: carboxypeptidase-like regulatory domain-containing protein [Pirellulales bacterium]
MKKTICLLSYAALCAAVLLTGCGKKGPPREEVFPVSGQILLEGKAIPNAQVTLVPTPSNPNGVIANAVTDHEGKFAVTTYVTGDGAAQGEYAVVVRCEPLIKNGQSFERGPNILPAKLSDAKTTDWKIQVAAQESNVLPPQKLKR